MSLHLCLHGPVKGRVPGVGVREVQRVRGQVPPHLGAVAVQARLEQQVPGELVPGQSIHQLHKRYKNNKRPPEGAGGPDFKN